jgi:hypothetical protein
VVIEERDIFLYRYKFLIWGSLGFVVGSFCSRVLMEFDGIQYGIVMGSSLLYFVLCTVWLVAAEEGDVV